MKEVWKPVPGYENLYEISDHGRVKSLAKDVKFNGCIRHQKEIIMSPQKDMFGYFKVQLHKDGIMKTCKIHRLVAEAFIPNPEHYRCINHKDEVKTNNHVSNLEWCTHKYNSNYGTGKNRGSEKRKKKVAQYDLNGKFVATYNSIGDASMQTGLCSNGIGQCCSKNKKYSTVGGFIWKFVTDDSQITLPIDKRIVKISQQGKLVSLYKNITDAAQQNNILRTSIANCLAGRSLSAGGFKWKYKRELL